MVLYFKATTPKLLDTALIRNAPYLLSNHLSRPLNSIITVNNKNHKLLGEQLPHHVLQGVIVYKGVPWVAGSAHVFRNCPDAAH